MRLKEFFRKTGVQKKWFADQVGMPLSSFYEMTLGRTPIPQKYWKKIIEVSEQKITVQDLWADSLENMQVKQNRKKNAEQKEGVL